MPEYRNDSLQFLGKITFHEMNYPASDKNEREISTNGLLICLYHKKSPRLENWFNIGHVGTTCIHSHLKT